MIYVLAEGVAPTTDQLSNKKWIVVLELIGYVVLISSFLFRRLRRFGIEQKEQEKILEGTGTNTSANSLFYCVKFFVRQPSFIFQPLKPVLNLCAN